MTSLTARINRPGKSGRLVLGNDVVFLPGATEPPPHEILPLIGVACAPAHLPLAGFSYHVRRGGLTEDTIRAFGLDRLAGVRQFGFKYHPELLASQRSELLTRFSHTRFDHVLSTGALALLIGTQNDLAEKELTLLRVAALVHDARTPAGGDCTKECALDGSLDEDDFFNEIFEIATWPEFAKQYGLDQDALTAVVQGQGMLGSLLDVADKISYTARDIPLYLVPEQSSKPYLFSTGFYALQRLTRENPLLCGLWESVAISHGQVVFTKPDLLVKFLKARALMFREVYRNPQTRFFASALARCVIKYLYLNGSLTRQVLTAMTDVDLTRLIEQECGLNVERFGWQIGRDTIVEAYATQAEALAREQAVVASGNQFVVYENHATSTRPGTDLLVETTAGTKTLQQIAPLAAQEITETITARKPFRVYILQPPRQYMRTKFLEAHRAWREKTS